MTSNTLNTLEITESGTHSFNFEGFSGEKYISIDGNCETKLFFLIHDANITLIIDVLGENASVACAAIIVSAGNIPSSIDFSVTLKASHTKADIYALSLLGNNAKATVNGGVVISSDIIKAEGYLAEENLLLGEKIQIKTLPMLDVRSNDVKASHGATISRLDEQKLFYLTAKGLPKETAEQLMIQSYIQKALDHAGVGDNVGIINHIFFCLSK